MTLNGNLQECNEIQVNNKPAKKAILKTLPWVIWQPTMQNLHC